MASPRSTQCSPAALAPADAWQILRWRSCEAQWESVCRAGTTKLFYLGQTISTELANDDGIRTDGDGRKGEDREQTTDV